jgi:hypothetical protein
MLLFLMFVNLCYCQSLRVPQGTVQGPLMFLLYINDIGNDITSKIRLFADDSLLYLAISTKDDCKRLQQDLDRMVNWTKTWQMSVKGFTKIQYEHIDLLVVVKISCYVFSCND